MIEHDDATLLRTWQWVQRSQMLAAAAGGVLALAVIQAIDPSIGSGVVLIVVVAGEALGAVIGNTAGGIVARSRGIPVRRPKSIASFALILGVAAILGLLAYLLAVRMGLHLRYPVATFVAIGPLLALLASEIVDGWTLRSRQ